MLVVNIKSTYKEVSSDSMMSKLDMRLRNTILEDDDEFISTANGGGSLVTKLCLTATPRTITHQAPLSLGFPRQDYWSGLPFPSLGDLPDPGIKLTSLALASRFFSIVLPGKPLSVKWLLSSAWLFVSPYIFKSYLVSGQSSLYVGGLTRGFHPRMI